MSDELLIGLAGGAIGAVLTGMFAVAVRALAAWGEVAVHDEEARERNAQLVVWVDDRTRALEIDMAQRSGDARAAGQGHGGAHGTSLAWAKSKALHEYRDEEWNARIDLARVRAREGPWHRAWRTARRRPAPAVTAETLRDIEPFLERWREPVTRHGGSVAPLDRTRRTTADAHAELPSLKLT